MEATSQSYFSRGKLLISSEYFVLDGALALAVPTRLGQEMTVFTTNNNQSIIDWEAYHLGKLWFKTSFNSQNLHLISTDNPSASEFIISVFAKIKLLNPNFFSNEQSFHIKTNLQFPANYGLGSSSTLMTNLANWTGVCPFRLNELSLGGSGYDVAVALDNAAILYKNLPQRKIEKINFAPPFSDELILIHLNAKQDSRKGIELYKSKPKIKGKIEEFSQLTMAILNAKTIEEFSQLMEIHEEKISSYLDLETTKKKYFSNAPVFIKSLGAWGGDFILTQKFDGYRDYFSEKGFSDIWMWKDIIY